METLQKLQEQEKKAQRKLLSIRHKMDEIKEKDVLPSVKKQYEGKYFKYRNSFSCPKAEKDYWYIYHHVTSVEHTSLFQCKSFQTDKDGKITIELKNDVFVGRLNIPITKREFDKAWGKLINKLTTP